MIKNSKYNEFFPYTSFRPGQERYIDQIEKSIRLRKNILLSAPNGTGKTVITLSAVLPVALERGLKIVYMCRTHTQSDRVIKELKKIHDLTSINTNRISGLSIRGRNEMCLNRTLLNLKASPMESMAICRNLRSNNNCPYYKNVRQFTNGFKSLDLFQFNKPLEAEELIELCKQKRYCPYFLAKYLLKKMPIIVCNFQWIFNPDIRFRFLKLLDTSLNNCILVIDEAHNIIDVATEVNSDKLIPYFLTSCINDLQMYKLPEKYWKFVRLIRNDLAQKIKDLKQETKIEAKEYLDKVCKALKFTNKGEFIAFLRDMLIEYKERIEVVKTSDEKEISKNNIKHLVRFWLNWCKKCESEKYFFCYSITRSRNRKYIGLEIVALDPREITVPIFRNSYACINLSGTVIPYVFKYLTGLSYKKEGYAEIIAPSPFKSKNVLALITEGVNTGRDSRNPMMFKKIINKIEEVISVTPANIGIFCASYRILEGLSQDIRMNNIFESMVQKYDKRLYIEKPQNSASKNNEILNQFKACSKKNGAVLLGVCGGRNSEGEDYPGDFMNAVIIVGVPYHLQTPRVKAKISYYDKQFNRQGWNFAYLYPAMQRANQASGRPIRKETDKGAIIFMDERFKTRNPFRWITDWAKKGIKTAPDQKGFIAKSLRSFWNPA